MAPAAAAPRHLNAVPATPEVVNLSHPLLDFLTRVTNDLAVLDEQAPAAPWQVELVHGAWWVARSGWPARASDALARFVGRPGRPTARLIARARTLTPGLVDATRTIMELHSGYTEVTLPHPACPGCGQVWPCRTLRAAALPWARWEPGYDEDWRP